LIKLLDIDLRSTLPSYHAPELLLLDLRIKPFQDAGHKTAPSRLLFIDLPNALPKLLSPKLPFDSQRCFRYAFKDA